MSMTFAAVGAVVAAVLESTLLRYVEIDGVHPHLVLIYAVIWIAVAGLDGGLAAAFVGGLALDFLTGRPLGSSVFVLLLTVGVAFGIARMLARVRYVAPIVAVYICSVLNSLLFLAVYGALRTPIPVADPFGTVLPGAVYDAILAVFIAPVAVAVHDRAVETERVDW